MDVNILTFVRQCSDITPQSLTLCGFLTFAQNSDTRQNLGPEKTGLEGVLGVP